MDSKKTLLTETPSKCFVAQQELGKMQEFKEEHLLMFEISVSEATMKTKIITPNNY